MTTIKDHEDTCGVIIETNRTVILNIWFCKVTGFDHFEVQIWAFTIFLLCVCWLELFKASLIQGLLVLLEVENDDRIIVLEGDLRISSFSLGNVMDLKLRFTNRLELFECARHKRKSSFHRPNSNFSLVQWLHVAQILSHSKRKTRSVVDSSLSHLNWEEDFKPQTLPVGIVVDWFHLMLNAFGGSGLVRSSEFFHIAVLWEIRILEHFQEPTVSTLPVGGILH